MVDKNLSFVKQMKKATQQIHDLSDAMINAKLGIGTYYSNDLHFIQDILLKVPSFLNTIEWYLPQNFGVI